MPHRKRDFLLKIPTYIEIFATLCLASTLPQEDQLITVERQSFGFIKRATDGYFADVGAPISRVPCLT
jgi:hypothetical protein